VAESFGWDRRAASRNPTKVSAVTFGKRGGRIWPRATMLGGIVNKFTSAQLVLVSSAVST
jgi:hypothetical protein